MDPNRPKVCKSLIEDLGLGSSMEKVCEEKSSSAAADERDIHNIHSFTQDLSSDNGKRLADVGETPSSTVAGETDRKSTFTITNKDEGNNNNTNGNKNGDTTFNSNNDDILPHKPPGFLPTPFSTDFPSVSPILPDVTSDGIFPQTTDSASSKRDNKDNCSNTTNSNNTNNDSEKTTDSKIAENSSTSQSGGSSDANCAASASKGGTASSSDDKTDVKSTSEEKHKLENADEGDAILAKQKKEKHEERLKMQ